MTAPSLRVEIGFGATASLGSFFVLDDWQADGTTPGPSTLDNTTNTLAGTVFVDVTSYISGQVSISRGRSRETDQYGAGTMSFTLRNEDRRFDPSNTAGPYYPGPQPRLLVNAYLTKGGTSVQIYGGYIDDIDIAYDIEGTSLVSVNCLDSFNVLANMTLRSFATTGGWSTGRAIRGALKAAGFTSAYNVANGVSTVQANSFDETGLLDLCQTFARTENGFFFTDNAGVVTFKNRHFDGLGVTAATFSDNSSDWPTAIGYSTLAQKSAALLLYNEVSGARNTSGGVTHATMMASDSASQAQYLPRALTLGQLENETNADVQNLCYYMLGRYSVPEVRFDSMSLEVAGVSDDQAATLLPLDITDTIQVTRTPPGSGTPSSITQTCLIDGINWDFDASSGSFRVTYNLQLLRSRQTFILDDTALGVLDTSKLDY